MPGKRSSTTTTSEPSAKRGPRLSELAASFVPTHRGDGFVRVVHARTREELSKLLQNEQAPIAIKASVPTHSTIPSGGVIVVPDFIQSGVRVDKSGGKTGSKPVTIGGTTSVEELSHAGVFLPLAGSKAKSVIGRLFDTDPASPLNYFQRSTKPLVERLQSVNFAHLSDDASGLDAWSKSADPSAQISPHELLNQRNKIVTDATLEADPNEHMKVYRLSLMYVQQQFETYVMDAYTQNVLPALEKGKLAGVDVTVEVFNKGLYLASLLMVTITICCAKDDPKTLFNSFFPQIPLDTGVLLQDNEKILHMEAGSSKDEFALDAEEFAGETTTYEFTSKIAPWLKEVAFESAFETNPNIRSFFRLLSNGKIYTFFGVFEDDPPTDRFKALVEDEMPKSMHGLTPAVSATPSRALLRTNFAAIPTVVATATVPGLEGITTYQAGQPGYDTNRAQYASFDGSYPDEDFRPHLIAVPKNESEIMTIIQYAVSQKRRVVVRSGGHQYCGMSSGKDDYVQILMEGMAKAPVFTTKDLSDPTLAGCTLPLSPDKNNKQNLATVTAYTKLLGLSRALRAKGLTVPHGECPKVCIGGHAQTGGYGHQMRALGLCLDHVYSFNIIIYDGTKPRLVTVYRPELKNPPSPKDPMNDAIYKGVLGGSPGGFGVVTQVTFLCVSDADPTVSASQNLQGIYPYFSHQIGQAVTNAVAAMLQYTVPGNELPSGVDIFVSVATRPVTEGIHVGILMPELAYTGNAFGAIQRKAITSVNDACISAPGGTIAALASRFLGKALQARPPSQVADDGVRTTNHGVTAEGREFDLPYKKRVNITTKPVMGQRAVRFAQAFGALAQKVVQNTNLRLVIQMMIGGDKSVSYDAAGRTGINYRDMTFGFVFDVFHEVGDEALKQATAIQQEMTDLLNEIGDFNHRLLWGSFEREDNMTNMNDKLVREMYYGTQANYDVINQLKRVVDPKGLFTTEFTVQGN